MGSICAWCNCIKLNGKWRWRPLRYLLFYRKRMISHSICPRCKEDLAEGRYPDHRLRMIRRNVMVVFVTVFLAILFIVVRALAGGA